MIPWVELLKSSLAEEWGDAPVIGALATVDEKMPRVRHVVVRRVGDEGDLLVTSRRDSGKNRQLRQNAEAEMAFWLPRLRKQFRPAGKVKLIDRAADRDLIESMWGALSEPTRLTFYWPEPGRPRAAADAFASSPPADTAIPETFEVLRLIPEKVEMLELSLPIHRRRCWTRDRGWLDEELNP